MAHPEQPLDQPLWDQVGSVLPVQVRCLPSGQQPRAWLPADILDISHGGMAQLIPHQPGELMGQPCVLDVSKHPGFGVVRLPGVPPLVQSRK